MSTDRHLHFRLPDVGEGLTEAEIVSWTVRVGDTVAVNDNLCEIETAKSIVELPSPVDGIVTELLVAEGQTVDVGSVIVTIDTAPGQPQADAPTATQPAETPAGGGPAGDEDSSGAVLVGYGTRGGASARRPRRTDAAPAPTAGPPAGAEPPTGTNTAPTTATRPPAKQSTPQSMARPVAGHDQDAVPSSGPRVLAKPPVRRLAKDLGIDLGAVAGTGPGGIITREDVLQHQDQTSARTMATWSEEEPWLEGGVVSADGRRTRVPARSVRKRTAEAMVRSAFTAPHVTEFHTVDVTRTMDLVTKLQSDRDFRDVKVTPLLVTMKALLMAVRRHPEVNAAWDDESSEIVYKHYVNLGIAANTPRGLVVPNIKDAHRKSLHELAVELGTLTETARAGKTSPRDMSDGTITITNVGAFGIDTGTPILNPGESAILALGAISERPWVVDGEIQVRWVAQLALSFDHRLVDGALGSVVLADVARVMEEPAQALVWS